MALWHFKIALAIGSTLLALGVMESIARVVYPLPVSIDVPHTFDPEVGRIPVPLERGRVDIAGVASFSYSNNSQGLRGGQEYGAKTKPRILLLGDSFTYGLGVNDDQTSSSDLQRLLPGYEVINGGNPDTGTDYALKYYETRGRQLHPDVVVLCFFGGNDFIDNQRHWYYDNDAHAIPLPTALTQPNVRPSPVRSWLVDHIRLVYIARAVFLGLRDGLDAPLTARYLSQIQSETKTHGVKFLVLFIPDSHHINGSNEQTAFAEITQAAHIDPVFLDLQVSDFLPEGHFGTGGHQVTARAIYNWIEKR